MLSTVNINIVVQIYGHNPDIVPKFTTIGRDKGIYGQSLPGNVHLLMNENKSHLFLFILLIK